MWLFTKYGFYSVVCARQGDGRLGRPVDTNRVMVRARVRDHLEALIGRFQDQLGAAEIQAFPGSDYAWRIFVPKQSWTTAVAALAEEVDYDNFKSAVAHMRGRDGYEQALHDVWEVMYRLQRPT